MRSLRIRKTFLGLTLCSLLLGGMLFSFFAWDYVSHRIEFQELQRLRIEASDQRQNMQRLVLDVERLQQELASLAMTEARIRQLANLEDDGRLIPVAMGGQPDEDNFSLNEIQQQINALQIDIELRRQAQQDVRNLLNDQISISRSTPKGWPTRGWLSSYFGKRKSPFTGRTVMHEGLDIAANTGTPVVAPADGIVARVTYSSTYGNKVVIDHGYGYQTLYAHNSRILVKVGQRVTRGERIAQVGNTGVSTGPHLHYEVHLNGVPIDPRAFL
ncbi:M23 family metallopeptidase [Pelovirga terrestris]|uniref:Peptidoglycan DD-metalloendopeptidase family protein n=1 Tax=Pelovirga terrestris TaxID=2771352 RepID=A0A8J6QW61_9BACT|nr:M23 family metallopeptidase [Pelovirga terrestris]MBD1399378.1 peptidoglycan DD-metalloendopeptidase family protein [Pelovirga terrestris]